MNIAIFGLGYVGCVSLGCLAQAGHTVVGVDVVPSKVERINSGRPTIQEKDIDTLIREQWELGRVSGTIDYRDAMKHADISLICVGTPSTKEGRLDDTALKNTAQHIGQAMQDSDRFHVTAIRSTVMPGASRMVASLVEKYSGKLQGKDFAVVSNPEFMREGSSVKDFLHPPMILLGSDNQEALTLMREMYAAIDAPVEIVEVETAELLKSVSNSFHALKVTFANEIGRICHSLDLDGHAVMRLFCKDTHLNISTNYLMPGFAYGGSCLPKDLRALKHLAHGLGQQVPLLDSIERSNRSHIDTAFKMILETGKNRVGLLGVSFKAGTDDLRESPSVELLKALLDRDLKVGVYDPGIMWPDIMGSNKNYVDANIPQLPGLVYNDLETLVSESEVLVVVHKHEAFENLEAEYPDKQFVDLVGLSDRRSGDNYRGIGW